MRIDPLTSVTARNYRKELSEFYYENMKLCSYLEKFSIDDANKKIEEFIDHLETDTCIGYGLFKEDIILGFIWAYPHTFREESRMYISEIRIVEEYRGMGWGKVLLNEVENKAKEMGFRALYLHAETKNTNVVNLYKLVGFDEERIQLRKEI